MRPDIKKRDENWTAPGSDSFDHPLMDTEAETACVYCGEYVPAFRKHFMDHYAAQGAEYGHYSAAYELGHRYRHDHGGQDWAKASQSLRKQWEHQGRGAWDDFKEAVKFGWSQGGSRGKREIRPSGW